MTSQKTKYFFIDAKNIFTTTTDKRNDINAISQEILTKFIEYKIPEQYRKIIIENVMSQSPYYADLIEYITEYPFKVTNIVKQEDGKNYLEGIGTASIFHPQIKIYSGLNDEITQEQAIEFYRNLTNCRYLEDYIRIMNEVLYDKGKEQSKMHMRVKKLLISKN